MYLSHSGMSTGAHEDTGCANMPSDGGQGRTALLDNRGRVGQSGWSSATYVFCRVEYEHSQQLAALRKRKNEVNVQ